MPSHASRQSKTNTPKTTTTPDSTTHDSGGQEMTSFDRPLTDADIIALQGMVGNQAVQRMIASGQVTLAPRRPLLPVQREAEDDDIQRMLITGEKLYIEGGKPTPHKMGSEYGIFGGKEVVKKEMSVRWRNIYKALGIYHDFLNANLVKADKTDRKRDMNMAVDELIHNINTACTTYLDQHRNEIRKARRKQTNNQNLSDKNKKALARDEAIKLVTDQIPRDVMALRAYATAETIDMDTWGNLNLHDYINLATTTGVNLESKKVQGDPTRPQNAPFAVDVNQVVGGPRPQMTRPMSQSGPNPVGVFKPGQIKALPNDPYSTAPLEVPTLDKLVQLGSRTQAADGVWTVTQGVGDAISETAIDPNRLFIDDDPRISEITQGGIGDCYFLAALNNVVLRNPELISERMKVVGDNVQYTFYRQDETGNYIPQIVSVPKTLAVRQSGKLKGASYKVGDEPIRHHWWVNANPKLLNIKQQEAMIYQLATHRRDYFEASLWAPYLEKLYAMFAQSFGKYGTEGAQQKGGYDVINEGGREQFVYAMFYGRLSTRAGEKVRYNQGKDEKNNVVRNKSVVVRLMQMMDQSQGKEKQVDISASAGQSDHLKRAAEAIQIYNSDPKAQLYLQQVITNPQIKLMFSQQLGLLQQSLALALQSNSPSQQQLNVIQMGAKGVIGSQQIWTPYLLQDNPMKPRSLTNLFDFLINLVTVGTDYSAGQRNIYSSHAYSVSSAKFRGIKVPNLPDLDSVTDELLQKIDPKASTVSLRNPHGQNTPNKKGGYEQADDGKFVMTLDEFLRNFSRLDINITDVSE